MQSIIYFFVKLHSNMDMIGDATVWTNLNFTHLITVMCNMVDLYELIQDLREFLIFFWIWQFSKFRQVEFQVDLNKL